MFQYFIEMVQVLWYNYHIKHRRVQVMDKRAGKKDKALSRKDRMEAVRSCAVEINVFLQGQKKLLDEAKKLGADMTGRERQRFFGAGVKNYGFIEKACDLAKNNPGYLPPHFDIDDMRESVKDFDDIRQLVFELEQYLRAANNIMLLESDLLYRGSLRVYAGLKEQARNKVLGAQALFDALRVFFHRRKRAADKPTRKETLRTAKKLLQGKTEGALIVRNEKPKITAGVREIVEVG
jgi:hypothetical protein